MRRPAVLLPAFLSLTLSACMLAAADTAGPAGRVVVRFTGAVADPAAPAFVADLARSAQRDLVYDRAVSGAAHLYRVPNLSDAEGLQRVAERLRRRPDVVHAEADRRLQPRTGMP